MMKREIYFRGWNVGRQDWVYGHLVVIGERHYIYSPGNSLTVVPESVGQYIGMRDKQLVRVFEGDIIGTDTGQQVVADMADLEGMQEIRHMTGHGTGQIIGNTFGKEAVLIGV